MHSMKYYTAFKKEWIEANVWPARLPVISKKRWARKERFTEVCKYHHPILMKQWPKAKKKKTFACVRFLETDGMYF